MSEFIITRRLACHRCLGQGWVNGGRCPSCDRKGFTETYLDADEWLLERLRALRFTIEGVPSDKFEVMRFED